MLMKTPDKVLTADLLDRAADALDEVGFYIGSLYPNRVIGPLTGPYIKGQPVCLIGALNIAEFNGDAAGICTSQFELNENQLKALKALGFNNTKSAYTWNDNVRDKEVITEKLRSTAARLRQEVIS